jgi:hypothetical protein
LLGKLATTYRPRRPRESPLYTLVDECCDEVKGSWEDRFERRYGFWRGMIEDAVHPGHRPAGSLDRQGAR